MAVSTALLPDLRRGIFGHIDHREDLRQPVEGLCNPDQQGTICVETGESEAED